MTTYRPLRIAPDLPNSEDDPRFEDTPPASPYQNRLPNRRGPSISISSFSIPLPSPRYLGWIAFFILSAIVFFTPRQYKPKILHPTHNPSLRYKNVDWRMFAYTTYATDQQHVCAALMAFAQLDELGSKADRMLFYPEDWDLHEDHTPEHVRQMLHWAKDAYKVKTMPVKVHGIKQTVWPTEPFRGLHRFSLPNQEGELDPSITKFLALTQTHYLRVIHFDPQITFKKHIDDLFVGPPARLAATRKYLDDRQGAKRLSGHLVVADPREEDAASLFDLAADMHQNDDYFDSQVLSEQFGDHAMILSHRVYGLNSGEFRREDHFDFFGNEWEEWVPERALREASIVVFDEPPMPKPWVSWPAGMPDHLLPHCDFGPSSDEDIGCRNRKTWLELYLDHTRRRKNVCRMMVIPGGRWEIFTGPVGAHD